MATQGGRDCGGNMQSDFTTARRLLERAQDELRGSDEISRKVCECLDLLIEAVATAEHRRPPAKIVPFPRWARR
ncbi:hypothetical protein [Chelativorans intermedius]|uniref:Uncharacterized protein n=1 Tax=Chelativorans intermedius TaxID=515947 RepID=A0ABV6D2Q9_9HYPH|nr:hypothetical protein [Chelativorans intermedius]MCT8997256.1 hypothetical protein [Chelativorans intermedius]